MVNKEQELTFEKISSFFSLINEMLTIIENDSKEIKPRILLKRLMILEVFMKQAIIYVEEASLSYTNIVKEQNINESKTDLTNNLALLLTELFFCKQKILMEKNDKRS